MGKLTIEKVEKLYTKSKALEYAYSKGYLTKEQAAVRMTKEEAIQSDEILSEGLERLKKEMTNPLNIECANQLINAIKQRAKSKEEKKAEKVI